MDKEQQKKDAREAQQQSPIANSGAVNTSRRRFGIGAASAAVVMSLHTQPLKAAANCTASGWVSGNTSRHPEKQECGGRTPGYWSGEGNSNQNGNGQGVGNGNSGNHWPSGWVDTQYERLNSKHGFPGLSTYSRESDDGDATLLDAVSGPGNVSFSGTDMELRQVLRFGTAALLNARYIAGYPLSEDEVEDMVTDVITTGEYVASTGDSLDRKQMHRFLKNTMDEPSWGPDGIA